MISLAGMTNLRRLSLGRNNLKKLEKLEDVAPSLEQLWMSYNQISSLEGLTCLTRLHTLYMSNNNIKSFSELEHLVSRELKKKYYNIEIISLVFKCPIEFLLSSIAK